MMRAIFLLLALLAGSAEAHLPRGGGGTPPSGPTLIMPAYNDLRANWQMAGRQSQGGIPTTRVNCTSAQSGGITLPYAPSGGDDTANINTAISHCPANTVVPLTTGTFKFSAQIANNGIEINRSNITLRGGDNCNNAGPPYCGTIILASPGGATQTYYTSSPANCNSCNGFAAPPIFISPAAYLNGYHFNWTGCAWGVNCDNNAAAYQLTADGVQGSYSITLNRVNGLTVGGWVRIDENDGATSTTGPLGTTITAAPDLLQNTGSPMTGRTVRDNPAGDNGVAYGALLNRTTSEIKLISNIGTACGSGATTLTVCFDTPLTINYRVSNVAQIYTPDHTFLTGVGIENLTIEGGVGGQSGGPLHMDFCAYCWLSKVETYYWLGGVGISNVARAEIDTSYFHDCSDCENNGNEYPLALDGATTETLIQDSIFRLAGKGMVGRSCGGGNVVAYSMVDDTFYQASSIGNYWLDMGLNGSHYAGCHGMLFEGNWADNCDNDNTHGNDIDHVYFRNQCSGLRTDFNDPSLANPSSSTYNLADAPVSDLNSISYAKGNSYPYTPGNRHAAGAMMTDYWMAFVGNVLGVPGTTCASGCTMTGWVYANTGASEGQKNKSIWMTGWVGGGSPDPYLTSASGTNTCNGSNPPGCTYFFRHLNYDTVTAGIVDTQSGYATVLPTSLYLSARPPFMSGTNCTYPWPGVTPNAGSPLQSPSGVGCSATDWLPAKARITAGTPFAQP